MLFSWLARRRRARILASPFPPEWLGHLERNVPLYARLSEPEQAVVRDELRVLVAEKSWEGCGGLVMTDEVKVTIAAHAALMLLGIEHDSFARIGSILVYPSGFRAPDGWTRPDGVVDASVGALGEAWYDGPVVLAWDAVVVGARDAHDGRNVVIHEFAHQLDYLDGVVDGTPPLRKRGDYKRWQEVMTREYEYLRAAAGTGTPALLDTYGATSHAEFFAVASEAFFERPREVLARHPELYAVMSEYYGQDLAGGVAAQKKGYRGSRWAAKEPHAATTLDWPGWVTFWEIHPGVSREQALRPLEHHIIIGLLFLICAIACFVWSYYHNWWLNNGMFLAPLGVLTMAAFAAWLRLAVRWVDRYGGWGGEFRPASPEPAEKADTDQNASAPLG